MQRGASACPVDASRQVLQRFKAAGRAKPRGDVCALLIGRHEWVAATCSSVIQKSDADGLLDGGAAANTAAQIQQFMERLLQFVQVRGGCGGVFHPGCRGADLFKPITARRTLDLVGETIEFVEIAGSEQLLQAVDTLWHLGHVQLDQFLEIRIVAEG